MPNITASVIEQMQKQIADNQKPLAQQLIDNADELEIDVNVYKHTKKITVCIRAEIKITEDD